MKCLSLLAGACLLLGCRRAPDRDAQAQPPPGPGEPPWLVLRVGAVNVAPFRPSTKATWDGPAPSHNDGAECGLLGLAVGLINPIAGKGAHLLCTLEARAPQQEQDPTLPDLAVVLYAGSTSFETPTSKNSMYAVFNREFVVPTAVIPPEGLSLDVIDRDGKSHEVLGHVRVTRQQLVGASLSAPPVLVLSDPAGGLQQLELIVTPAGWSIDSAQVSMKASQGTTVVPSRPVRAGEVVEIVATGRYRIGSYYDHELDPRGYPGGGPRDYNFSNEPFHSARHGAGIALLGGGDAQQGLVVAPCGAVVSRVSGKIAVGVNDTDPHNNHGSLQFSVRIRPATPAEWLSQQASPCGSW